jgi:hypothetical protein
LTKKKTKEEEEEEEEIDCERERASGRALLSAALVCQWLL